MRSKKIIRSGGSRGFTLIEVIAAIVIMAVVSAMIVSTLGTNLRNSALPVGWVGNQYKIVQEMEILTRQYRQAIADGTLLNLTTFKATVDANPYVDAANTGYVTLSSTTGGGYTSQQVLLVTLKDGDQFVQSVFTP